jgi:hypothetical protein
LPIGSAGNAIKSFWPALASYSSTLSKRIHHFIVGYRPLLTTVKQGADKGSKDTRRCRRAPNRCDTDSVALLVSLPGNGPNRPWHTGSNPIASVRAANETEQMRMLLMLENRKTISLKASIPNKVCCLLTCICAGHRICTFAANTDSCLGLSCS